MKALLIFPNTRRNSIFFPSIIQPPLGIAYVAAMARTDHDVRVIDAAAENLKFEQIFQRVAAFKPDLVGITTNISIAYIACELSLRLQLRFKGLNVALGGPWATSNPEYLLQHKYANYVILGEGEYVFKELLDALQAGTPVDDIPGIALRLPDGSAKVNPQRDFIHDLDVLPFPAWDLFPLSTKYFHHYRHPPLYPMMITRGCPFGCIHCSKMVHGYKIRERSPESVIAEMRYLIDKFKVREIIIVDDNFTFDVPYAEKILDAIIDANLGIYLQLPNGIRADSLSPHLLVKMRRAGVYGFAIGVESGVQHIVNRIGKRLDLKKVRYAARIAKKHGILLRAFFILGLPYDSLDTMKQTVQFAKEIDPDFAYFFVATLFPGTEMYDIVEGMAAESTTCADDLKAELSSVDHGFYLKPVSKFTFGKLKPGDVAKAYKYAVRVFYMRPLKVIKILGSIKSMNELKWILHYFATSMLNIFSGVFGHEVSD